MADTTILFTGTLALPRKEATAAAKSAGYAVASNFNKKVNLLVVGVDAGEKVAQAEERGVKCVSEAEFVTMLRDAGVEVRDAPPAKPKNLKRTRAAAAADDEDGEEDDEDEEEPAPKPKRARAAPAAKPVATSPTAASAPSTSAGGSPADHVVVFSGTLSTMTRKEATAQAESFGYKFGSSVTKKTTILVAVDVDGAKVAKARESGVTILTEDQWQARLNGHPSASDAPAAAASSTAAAAGLLVDHPAVTVADLASGVMDEATAYVAGIAPLRVLADGETVLVESASSSSSYKVKRVNDHYSCTCPSWRMQKTPVDARTCKHLKQMLGEEYEAARCGAAPAAASSRPKRSAGATARKGTETSHNINVLLAHKWNPEKDNPTGWHMSEKLDGLRAYFCPHRRGFFSRAHNEFPVPDWFIEGMPADMALDGELFCGRGMFQSTTSIVRAAGGDARWKTVYYHIFDAPSVPGPFETRIAAIQKFLDTSKHPQLKLVPHVVCTGVDHVLQALDEIEKQGGEGLMLREPKSAYAFGRSHSLKKVKSFADGEALVIGHQLSTSGKFGGMLGALECRMASGKEFRVGSGFKADERELSKAPPIGSLIKYKCQELTRDGIPRFPRYLGVAEPDRTEPSDPVFNNGPGDE
ncbi:hypothetical protein H9P43_009930 [Blastocladiella emersonii ATCC 22665]|nr:hypothetical protein H9P43_009930 [Blastocladiella emersonii ATCC 22665]